jgi:hypothetical protein
VRLDRVLGAQAPPVDVGGVLDLQDLGVVLVGAVAVLHPDVVVDVVVRLAVHRDRVGVASAVRKWSSVRSYAGVVLGAKVAPLAVHAASPSGTNFSCPCDQVTSVFDSCSTYFSQSIRGLLLVQHRAHDQVRRERVVRPAAVDATRLDGKFAPYRGLVRMSWATVAGFASPAPSPRRAW